MADADDEEEDRKARSRANLAALAVILVLVLGALFVGHVLKGASDIQDCVMSGRTNCAPIDTNR